MEFVNKILKAFGVFYRFSATWKGTIIIVLFVVFFIAQAFVIPSRSMANTLFEGDLLFAKKFSYGIPIPRIPWINIPILPDFNNNGHLIEGKRPKRGEIVIFIPPHLSNTYFVKRTFAVGGDEVIMAKDGLYLRPFEGDSYIDEHFSNFDTKIFFGKRFIHDPFLKQYKGVHYRDDNLAYNLLLKVAQNAKGAMSVYKDENGEYFLYHKVDDDNFYMIGDNRDRSEDSRFWGSVPYSNIIGTPWVIYLSINLRNSEGVSENPLDIYRIRWDRMFKGLKGIEELANKNALNQSFSNSLEND